MGIVMHQTCLVQWTWNIPLIEIILEQAMSATHVAVILHMRTGPGKEEFLKKWLSLGEWWLPDI